MAEEQTGDGDYMYTVDGLRAYFEAKPEAAHSVTRQAFRGGNWDVIELVFSAILDKKIKIYGVEIYETVLFHAIQHRKIDLAGTLLHMGVNVNATEDGTPALYLAAQHGFVDILQLLIDHGADVNQVTMFGKSAITVAKTEGILRVLLSHPNIELNIIHEEQPLLVYLAKNPVYTLPADLLLLALHNPRLVIENPVKGIDFMASLKRVDTEDFQLFFKLLMLSPPAVSMAILRAAPKIIIPMQPEFMRLQTFRFLVDKRLTEAFCILFLEGGLNPNERQRMLPFLHADLIQQTLDSLLDTGVADILLQYQILTKLPYRNTEFISHNNAPLTPDLRNEATQLDYGDHTCVIDHLFKGTSVSVLPKQQIDKFIFAAVQRNCKNLLKLLFDQGVTAIARNRWGNTPLHFACTSGNVDLLLLLLHANADVRSLNVEGLLPMKLINSTKKSELLPLLRDSFIPRLHKRLDEYNSYPKVTFGDNSPVLSVPVTSTNKGWIANESMDGCMLVDESDLRPIVYIPHLKLYGTLQSDNQAMWEQEGKLLSRDITKLGEVQLFYGAPELGRNFVWKPLDADPSVYLNLYQRAKEFLHPLEVVTRRKVDGVFRIGTFTCPLEVLQIYGESISAVFPGYEVLSLHNVAGEGISLTHIEWDFMASELRYFPDDLTNFLLNENPTRNMLIEQLLGDFIEWLFIFHPLRGDIRVCNKLLSLVQHSVKESNNRFVELAQALQKRIETETLIKCTELIEQVGGDAAAKDVVQRIERFQPDIVITSQVLLTGTPKWYKHTGTKVDEAVVLQLLMNTDQVVDLHHILERKSIVRPSENLTESQKQMIQHLTKVFHAEFRPTYDDLLCKAYIKVAYALNKTFSEKLYAAFGNHDVKIAPIKELLRCQDKLKDIEQERRKPPFAAHILDYLRATVTCEHLNDLEVILEQLGQIFPLLRVKCRILPTDRGNKAVLTNVKVAARITPVRYHWSGWWDNTEEVAMIGEVQIAVRDLFYLDKQTHATYEIVRKKDGKWVYQQGYENVVQEIFPMSPLHNNPLCLL